MASRIHIDKLMGGVVRDKDGSNSLTGIPEGMTLEQYIQDLFNNATFNWSQITGDPSVNQDLINYLNSLIEQINRNIIETGELITNDMKSYIQNLLNHLTITWEQIIGSPAFNEDFKTYIDNLVQELTNQFNEIIGSPVTNEQLLQLLEQYKQDILNAIHEFIEGETVTTELKQYIDNLLQNIQTQLNELINSTNLNETILNELQEQISNIEQVIQNIHEGDVISQEYKDYIDQQFQDIYDTINQITEGNHITEQISQYIDDRLTEITEALQQFISNYITNNIDDIVNEIVNINGESTRLISGFVAWEQNLDFFVSALVYQILNKRYTSPGAEKLTIPANTTNNPVFAVIYADIFGQVGYILGTPSPYPFVPHVNETTQIELTTVYIPANSNEPGSDPGEETGEITEIVIYDENQEWDTSKTEETNVSINLESTQSPAKGLKHILVEIDPGISGGFENLGLKTTTEKVEKKTNTAGTGAVVTQDILIPLKNFFPDANTDRIEGDIRTLVWYSIQVSDITGYAVSRETGIKYNLTCSNIRTEQLSAEDVGVLVDGATLCNMSHQPFPGNMIIYDVYLKIKYTRFEQSFRVSTSGLLTVQNASMAFDAPAPVNAKGGTIKASLKTSSELIEASTLLFEIYNDNKKTGSLALNGDRFFGFNRSNTEYQRIFIPISAFNPTDYNLSKLVIRILSTWTETSLCIDNIVLQTGINEENETDRYVSAMTFDQQAKTLILKRTAGLPELVVEIPYPDAAQGEPGTDGLSAYQVAVSNGFVGTEEEWLQSLKGEQGEPGETVNADWNATSGPSMILNKPTIEPCNWARNSADGNLYPANITDHVAIGVNYLTAEFMLNVSGGINNSGIRASTTKSTGTGVYGSATAGTGVYGYATTGSGIYGAGMGTNGIGGSFSGAGKGIMVTSDILPASLMNTSGTSNSPVELLRLGSTNHTVTVGYGLYMRFSPPLGSGLSGNMTNMGRFGFVYTDVTASAERGDFYWELVSNGTAVERMRLTNIGNLIISGTLTESSSIRWKRNVAKIEGAIDKVTKLTGVEFDWDEGHGGKHDIGLIAEDVATVLPELVTVDSSGDASGVAYTKLTAVLIEAIKELTLKINSLETQLSNYLSKNE